MRSRSNRSLNGITHRHKILKESRHIIIIYKTVQKHILVECVKFFVVIIERIIILVLNVLLKNTKMISNRLRVVKYIILIFQCQRNFFFETKISISKLKIYRGFMISIYMVFIHKLQLKTGFICILKCKISVQTCTKESQNM